MPAVVGEVLRREVVVHQLVPDGQIGEVGTTGRMGEEEEDEYL